MAPPVWVLSVDLQTKTATFQTGMADAVRSARGGFSEIKAGAQEMGVSASGSMMEARHGVMLLGEEFGVHLPRALTTFIASIGPVGAAMEAAFPFLAIIVGATLLIEHLGKVKEAAEKLTDDQAKFSTAVLNVFNALDSKILQAGIRADELSNNHLGALHKQLELIDRQSMNELVRSFEEVAKAADSVFADLKVRWYEAGSGSAGAKHALREFKNEYDSLLAQGKDKEASDLLAGTLKSAERVRDLQIQAKSNRGGSTADTSKDIASYNAYVAASNELKKIGVGFTKEEIASQQTLVDVLQAQVGAQERVSALKKLEDSNVKRAEKTKSDNDYEKWFQGQWQAAKRAADEANKQWERTYNQSLADLEENERQKIEATDKGSAARLAAIDAAIRDENDADLQETGFYRGLLTARVETVRQKAQEEVHIIEQRHAAMSRAIDEDARDAESRRKVAQTGLTSGVGAGVISKLHEQEDLRRILQQEQTDLIAAHQRAVAEEQSFISRMNELAAQGSDEGARKQALLDAAAAQDKLTASTRQFNEEMARNRAAITASNIETGKLDSSWRNWITQSMMETRSLAATMRGDLQTSMQNAMNAFSQGIAQSIVEGKSFGSTMQLIARQMSESMIEGLIQWGLQDLITKTGMKLSAASLAGANATASMAGAPFPVDAGAPAFGASMMVTALGFAKGGMVPGVGLEDVVPAMLTPGETIIPKDLTEKLQSAARSGTSGATGETHFHHHAEYHIHAIDGASVAGMLKKHGSEFEKHFHHTVRRMNQN